MLSICRKDESEEEETGNGPLKKLIKKDSFQVDWQYGVHQENSDIPWQVCDKAAPNRQAAV